MKMLAAVRRPQNPPGTVTYAAGLKGSLPPSLTASNCALVGHCGNSNQPRLATCCVGSTLSGTKRLLREGLSASRYRFQGKGRWGTRRLRPFPLNLL